MAAFEAAGDPERYPDARRAVAAAQALLPPLVQPAADAGAARRDARARPGVAVGRAAQGVEARARVRTPGSPRGCRAASTSRSATRRCWRTPPRSTRTGTGSRSRCELQQEVWPTEDYELVAQPRRRPTPEDDLFAGIARRRLRDWGHDVPRCPPRPDRRPVTSLLRGRCSPAAPGARGREGRLARVRDVPRCSRSPWRSSAAACSSSSARPRPRGGRRVRLRRTEDRHRDARPGPRRDGEPHRS